MKRIQRDLEKRRQKRICLLEKGLHISEISKIVSIVDFNTTERDEKLIFNKSNVLARSI